MTREEADSLLRQAIINHAVAFGLAEHDELLNEYVVVAHWQKVEDDGRSRYTTQFHQNFPPHHVAVGLLRYGEYLVVNSGAEEDE